MPVNLDAYDKLMPIAVRHFWESRSAASTNQAERGMSDQGERSSVTAGKNLDGFSDLIKQIVVENGISETAVFTKGRYAGVIPGYYRPTKNWDLLVVKDAQLVAAIEFKSQVGSFGNNFNNRVEEALGNSTDLLTAFREGVLGGSVKPFLGYVFVLEDGPNSTSPVKIISPHFPTMPEFNESSYADHYEILCHRLVQEQLYDAAALVLTKPDGGFRQMSSRTSLKNFVVQLAGRMASAALID